jgi:hypothetical protein
LVGLLRKVLVMCRFCSEIKMEASAIKFKTIQFINGTKYLSEKQVEDLGYIMCHNLEIEKCEENFAIVREACKTYFELQMSLP